MNDCEVDCMSRMTCPARRATFGSWSGPKKSSAAAPKMSMSAGESKGFLLLLVQRCASTQTGRKFTQRTGGGRLKIIYTRGNRTETLASISTLRKILGRFVRHRVFYEVSSRNKRGHEFFSTKNTFVVGSIEVVNRDYLTITIFDAHNSTHSIEILNPSAMRIYDETMGKGFAVSFLSESPGDVESRCYLRDEGGEGDTLEERGELEKITLPKLFEYLEEITHVQGVGGPRVDPPHAGI
jgi:hypothetical protein